MMPYNLIYFVFFLFAIGGSLIIVSHILCKSGAEQEKRDWIKYGIYFLLVGGILVLAYAGKDYLTVFLIIVAIVGGWELAGNLNYFRRWSRAATIPFAIILFVSLGHLLLNTGGKWFDSFAFVFLVVSVTDSFSQLWGRLFGRYKLCPRLSPGKTIEGMIGGIITAMASAVFLGTSLAIYRLIDCFWPGFILAMAAIAGDLFFSFIKRRLGIKDFSGVLPGHGGLLDRFDSLIIAAPCYYWASKIILT
jgi:phosphatidate cytidylyltransferase